MTVTITYTNDDTPLVLRHVQSIKVVGFRLVEFTCFGNDPVLHRNVKDFAPETFSFEQFVREENYVL